MRRFALAAAALVMGTTAVVAWADPFEDARYDIGIKKNADALRIIDSGQFDVNMQTAEGYTLLHYAADQGNLDMVRALLQRGADPTLKAASGSSALDMATNTMIRAELAKAAANWGRPATSPAGAPAAPAAAPAATPVAAASAGNAGVASNGTCAAARAEPTNNGRPASSRPFLKARDDVWHNHPDELALLIEDCVPVDQRDSDGSTLLMVAADRDRIDAARVLMAHGANCSLTSTRGDSALGLAKSAEMRTLLSGCKASAAIPVAASGQRKTECQQKYQADAALCSDSSCRATAQRKWGQCLKTGNYW